MTTQTLATADGLLKDIYTDLVVVQTNYKTYMLDTVQRDATHVDAEGRQAVFTVESAPNPSHGAISDGGTLPDVAAESYAKGTVLIKYFSGGFEISDQLAKMGGPKGVQGMTSAIERGTKALQRSFRKNINRVVFGAGDAVLAKCTTSQTSTTINLDSVQYVHTGDIVDIVTRATGAVISASNKVTGRSVGSVTITLTSSVTVTNAEGVYLQGSWGLETDGLRNITGISRTLHGIDSSVAANSYWNGNQVLVNGGTGGPTATNIAGENSFIKLANAVGQGGEDEVGTFVTTRGVRDRLAAQFQSMRRYNDAKAVEIHGGYSVIYVNEIPVIFDDDCPKNWAFGLPADMDVFTFHEVGPPDWLTNPDNGGQVWHLAVSSTAQGRRRAAWQCWFNWYAALGCTAANRTAQIPDCQDDLSA